MNMLIASFMFIALLAVSFAHLVWSLGRTWPIRDEKLLAQTVVGTPGIQAMPPRTASFGVAIGMLIAGVTALALADHDSGGLSLSLFGLLLGALFLARGVVGFTGWWAQKRPESNFRLNDRRVYTPASLLLGVGFIALVIMRFI